MATLHTEFEFSFSAAVRLPDSSGPTKRVHGHNYRVQLVIAGEVEEPLLRALVDEVVMGKIDHRPLNETIPVPTCGNVAGWISAALATRLPGLSQVAVFQTPQFGVRLTVT